MCHDMLRLLICRSAGVRSISIAFPLSETSAVYLAHLSQLYVRSLGLTSAMCFVISAPSRLSLHSHLQSSSYQPG